MPRSDREALGRPRPGLLALHIAVLGRSLGREPVHEARRRPGDLLDGSVEGGLIRGRGPGAAADLANVLQGGSADFFFGGRGFEVEERADVAAHGRLSLAHGRSVRGPAPRPAWATTSPEARPGVRGRSRRR